MRATAALTTAFTLLVLCVAPALAQDGSADPKDSEEPAPAPEEPLQPVRGVRYRVWMKTGRSMEGVVRAKSVFEARTPEGEYRSADEDEEGVGVRFWYPSAQDGYIFMPLKAIERLEELGELSADEGRKIARARSDAAKRAEAERFEIKARIAAEEAAAEGADDASGEGGEPGEAEGGAGEGEEPAAEKGPDAGKMAALLLQYPPTRWSLESPQEIERRKVVLGLFPSDEEKAFLEVFDDWKIAYTAWAEATKEAEGGAGETSGEAKTEPEKSASARPSRGDEIRAREQARESQR